MKVLLSKLRYERIPELRVRTDVLQEPSGNIFVRKTALGEESWKVLLGSKDLNEYLKNNSSISPAEINRINSEDKSIDYEFIQGKSLEKHIEESLLNKNFRKADELFKQLIETTYSVSSKNNKEFHEKINKFNVWGEDLYSIKRNELIIPFSDVSADHIILNDSMRLIDYEDFLGLAYPVRFVQFRAVFYMLMNFQQVLGSVVTNEYPLESFDVHLVWPRSWAKLFHLSSVEKNIFSLLEQKLQNSVNLKKNSYIIPTEFDVTVFESRIITKLDNSYFADKKSNLIENGYSEVFEIIKDEHSFSKNELKKIIESLSIEKKNLSFELEKAMNIIHTIKASKFFRVWQYFQYLKSSTSIFKRIARKLRRNLERNVVNENYNLVLSAMNKKVKKNFDSSFLERYKFSIILPVYDPDPKLLIECIESVRKQFYPNWELCICDDNSKNDEVRKILKKYEQTDARIKLTFHEQNKHISAASNSALNLATGNFIGLLDHDDTLTHDALQEVAFALSQDEMIDFVYSNEDKLSENGRIRDDVFLKPDWSPDLLMSFNYITHFAVLKKELVDLVGGFRVGFEGSQDYDLFLRCSEMAKRIVHLDKVLYSWRKVPNSTAFQYSVKSYAHDSAKRALIESLVRRGLSGIVEDGKAGGTFSTQYTFPVDASVDIIIPSKDNPHLLKSCIESILNKSTFINFRILIVDTGSRKKNINTLYQSFPPELVSIYRWKDKFNFSSVCNWTAKKSKADFLIFLNDDTEIISENWIQLLLQHASRKTVGAVGAKLLYPNGKIQHAGIELLENYWPHHYKISAENDVDPSFPFPNYTVTTKNPDAVTGALLMVERNKFKSVGGFNEKYGKEFQDVLFCKSLEEKGYFTVYEPSCEVTHHESSTFEKSKRSLEDVVTRFFRTRAEIMKYKKRFSSFASKVDPELKQVVNQINSYEEK